MTKITLHHWAWLEGRDGAAQGYTGPNPYLNASGTTRFQWQAGYIAEINRRLDNGADALPQKEMK